MTWCCVSKQWAATCHLLGAWWGGQCRWERETSSSVTARTRLQNTGHHASALQAVTNRSNPPATLFSCYGKHMLTKYWSPCLGFLEIVTNRYDPPENLLPKKIVAQDIQWVVASSISIMTIINIQREESNFSKRLLPKIESINGGRVASELWSDDYLTTDILINGYFQGYRWKVKNTTMEQKRHWCLVLTQDIH